MTSLLPGAAFIAALSITAPVWAQGSVTPSDPQRPAPEAAAEAALDRTVVLRGSPANLSANSPGTETSSRSGHSRSTFGYTRYYGVNRSFDGNFNNNGFNRSFDGSGLTR